jgi:non-specific serine/threonine protein kinase
MTRGDRLSGSDRPAPQPPAAGRELRALREASGLTREVWSALLGYGRTTVQRWETGKTVPDAAAEAAIVALCRERALFRRYDQGPLAGVTATPEWLGGLLAAARLAGSGPRAADTAAGSAGPALARAALPHSTLPHALTSFIGRAQERAEVARLLTRTRLLTLTGTGGCGKTRLAIEAARDLLDRHPDGVWLVELAAVADPALIPGTVATALGVREEAGHSIAETLIGSLGDRRLLLVLDNCEHLAAACAALADAALRTCPNLAILATSRERLGIAGETVWRVPPMAVSASGGRGSEIGSVPAPDLRSRAPGPGPPDAVRLFVERAQAVRPSFALSNANVDAVVQVCRRLDGNPLAIELAAARLNVLSVEQVASRLDDRFRLLTTGSRTGAPRHQTLRALVDWSYDLLAAPEQQLFDRLSVFAGSFRLEAVEAICSDGEPVLDTLARLVDTSLVLVDETGGAARYRLLETLRQYARERLADHGEVELLSGRHRDFYLALAEEAEPKLRGPEQSIWLERLAEEIDNIRAALRWCEQDPSGAEAGLRFARALWRFWQVRGLYAEGRDWLRRALAREGDVAPLVRSRALNSAGALASGQGDYQEAARLYSQSLTLARAADDPVTVANALNNLGLAHTNLGRDEAARAFHEEGLAIRRSLDDQWGMSVALLNLGFLAQRGADYSRARSLYEESLAIKRTLGDTEGIAACLENLGDLALLHGEYDRARRYFIESRTLRQQLGGERGMAATLRGLGDVAHRQGEHASAAALYAESLAIAVRLGVKRYIAECLEGLAAVACALDRPERAAQLLGAADALRAAINAPRPPSRQALHDEAALASRAALGEVPFAVALEDGRATALEEAVARAMRDICGR